MTTSLKIGDMITFKVTRPFLNDSGKLYTARIIAKFINGLKVERDGCEMVIMYQDIEIQGGSKI